MDKINFPNNKIFYYDVTDSTNARAKANTDAPEWSVFIAKNQTAGRGRGEHLWKSGSGIYMSILLKPEISAEKIPQITLICGMSILKVLKKYTKKEISIKWPNDILIGRKKVCGILTEFIKKEENCVIVGIGINVNDENFGGDLKEKATSLLIEEKRRFDCSKIIASVLDVFKKDYEIFLKDGFEAFKEEYERLCINIGKEAIIDYEKCVVTVKGVDCGGGLIVEKDGKTEIINSGEVSVRGIYGYV